MASAERMSAKRRRNLQHVQHEVEADVDMAAFEASAPEAGPPLDPSANEQHASARADGPPGCRCSQN